MSDTIYRQAAIDELKEHRALYCDNTPDTFSKLSYAEKCRVDELDEAIATLVNLPSAQSEPRWTPCSERLPEHPENDDYYLVTIQCEHYAGWDDYVTGFAEWTKHGWDELSYYIGQIKVVAWMPLPKPYERSEE